LARASGVGLRMTAGWPLAQFQERTGFELQAEWRGEIDRMLDLGCGKLDQQRFQLTRQGLRYADWAAGEFLRGGLPL
jgi:coproporphyrinogen III oxidase-like Fe-S oxidoreductase